MQRYFLRIQAEDSLELQKAVTDIMEQNGVFIQRLIQRKPADDFASFKDKQNHHRINRTELILITGLVEEKKFLHGLEELRENRMACEISGWIRFFEDQP